MAKERLGKGLDAIFGPSSSRASAHAEGVTKNAGRAEREDGEKKAGEKEQLVRIGLIQPNRNQPRKDFDEEKLQELAESIRLYGVIQPLIVKKQGPLYEIVAGERRWRAAKLAGLSELPVIVRDFDEKTAKEISIIENIQRSDLNPVEEAMAYQSLLTEYGLTQEELASRVSKNRSTITNSLRLLKLEPEILSLLREGKLSQGHARALLGIGDSALRRKISERCAREELSVREIEGLAREGRGRKKEKKGSEEGREREQLVLACRELEKRMKSRLGTKVSIVSRDGKRGRLEIEYYSPEDLERISSLLKI